MLYPYQAHDQGEITVDEGKEVTVIEPDDGGWTKIKFGFGHEGLVPTSYIELLPTPVATPTMERTPSLYSNSSASLAGSMTAKKKGPAVAPRRGAKRLQYVEAIYEYAAQSDAEFSMTEGERFVLITDDSGDGWAEVEKGGERRSVPANYVQKV